MYWRWRDAEGERPLGERSVGYGSRKVEARYRRASTLGIRIADIRFGIDLWTNVLTDR